YADNSFWAVSNSFLVLARKVREVKGALSPYKPATLIFLVEKQGLFGGQLISNNTVVEGIGVLPLRHHIRICRGGLDVVADSQALPVDDVSPQAYRAAVELFLRHTHSRMAALATVHRGRS